MSVDYRAIRPGQELELYISPSCPYCAEARSYYDTHNISYEVHDAQNDFAARARMFALTGDDPTVPVIVVDGKYVRSGWGDPPQG